MKILAKRESTTATRTLLWNHCEYIRPKRTCVYNVCIKRVIIIRRGDRRRYCIDINQRSGRGLMGPMWLKFTWVRGQSYMCYIDQIYIYSYIYIYILYSEIVYSVYACIMIITPQRRGRQFGRVYCCPPVGFSDEKNDFRLFFESPPPPINSISPSIRRTIRCIRFFEGTFLSEIYVRV